MSYHECSKWINRNTGISCSNNKLTSQGVHHTSNDLLICMHQLFIGMTILPLCLSIALLVLTIKHVKDDSSRILYVMLNSLSILICTIIIAILALDLIKL